MDDQDKFDTEMEAAEEQAHADEIEKLAGVAKEVTELKAKHGEALTKLKAELKEAHREEIQEREAAIEALEAQSAAEDELKKELESIKQELAIARAGAALENPEETHAELAQLKVDLEEAKTELEKTAESLAASVIANQGLEGTVDTMTREMEHEKARHRKLVAELESTQAQMAAELESTQAQMAAELEDEHYLSLTPTRTLT